MNDIRPMGEQPRPAATAWHPASAGKGTYDDPGVISAIELRFPSAEMADAYLAWLDSGEAHSAFGTWYDSRSDL